MIPRPLITLTPPLVHIDGQCSSVGGEPAITPMHPIEYWQTYSGNLGRLDGRVEAALAKEVRADGGLDGLVQ